MNDASPSPPNERVLDEPVPGERAEPPASNRRPLAQPLPRTWFLRTPMARRYAIREASSLFVAAGALHLMCAVVAIARGYEHWRGWLAFARNPVVVTATVVVVAMSLLHSVTWFHVSPAVVRLRVGTRRLPRWAVIAAQYVAALAVLVALVAVVVVAGGGRP